MGGQSPYRGRKSLPLPPSGWGMTKSAKRGWVSNFILLGKSERGLTKWVGGKSLGRR